MLNLSKKTIIFIKKVVYNSIDELSEENIE